MKGASLTWFPIVNHGMLERIAFTEYRCRFDVQLLSDLVAWMVVRLWLQPGLFSW